MEKIIKVGKYEIPAKSNAGILLTYKRNFKEDALQEVVKLASLNSETLEGLDTDVFFKLLWVLAKTANNDIPPLDIWIGDFDIDPITFIMESVDDVLEMVFSNLEVTQKKR